MTKQAITPTESIEETLSPSKTRRKKTCEKILQLYFDYRSQLSSDTSDNQICFLIANDVGVSHITVRRLLIREQLFTPTRRVIYI